MMKRFWKWLKGNQDDHHWKHIPWSKTPPMPKRVEPGQGVRGETLGPKETIIPPKGGSGTACQLTPCYICRGGVNLNPNTNVVLPKPGGSGGSGFLGITKEEWDMEQMRMKMVQDAASKKAVSAMKCAQKHLGDGNDYMALRELQEAREHIDCLRKGEGR